MRFIERFWKRLSGSEAAEKAELAGDLPRAIQLWAAAGSVDEAARVMTLRGDAEPDPKLRLQHYTQAAGIATDGSPEQKAARGKKAKLVVSLAEGGALSAALRRDVIAAAAELEETGDAAGAAEAYALAGDTEGEARALAAGGEVERLEDLLSLDQAKTNRARRAEDVHAEIDALIASGQRRKALSLAEGSPDDPLSRSRASRLRGSRAFGPIVRVTLQGKRHSLVLGDEVTIGRSEGAITVASSAMSRRHVQIAREAGRIVVSDLGSRNGTQIRGLAVAARLEITGEVTLTLGGEVPLRLAPSEELADALTIEIAGERYLAPLGAARLGVGSWRLTPASDGWIELDAGEGPSPFAGGLGIVSPVTLLRGDAISSDRGGDVVLRVDP